jgi:hypothetical protein
MDQRRRPAVRAGGRATGNFISGGNCPGTRPKAGGHPRNLAVGYRPWTVGSMPNVLHGTWAIPPGVARSSAACLRRRGPEVHATEQPHADRWPFTLRWPPALGRLPEESLLWLVGGLCMARNCPLRREFCQPMTGMGSGQSHQNPSIHLTQTAREAQRERKRRSEQPAWHRR